MTLPPPKEWREGSKEQQAAFQGFQDGRKERGFEYELWRDISRKCYDLYSDYHEAGTSFSRMDRTPLQALRLHVTGAIERGEKEA